MSYADFLSSVTKTESGLTAEVPESWKQGRTTYGGISTALCLMAAQDQLREARPLRSALISFVGPSGGSVEVKAERLRSGRTASSVRARLTSEAGIGAETVFTFADGRESALALAGPGLPEGVAPPPAGAQGGNFPEGAPQFTRNFELYLAGGTLPFTGATGRGPLRFWTRFQEPEARTGLTALLCLADALPPAITTHLKSFAPLSSMTWMVDMLSEDLSTEGGWYLLQSEPEHAEDGYSAQTMTIWSTDGRCIVRGRQMVTVFA
ncbi:thioesterase family protein [Maricaulaceae bacterium EIL42A08]|nr:thioesterase family protein [Maricaulaceae bacterium EIL42A08]